MKLNELTMDARSMVDKFPEDMRAAITAGLLEQRSISLTRAAWSHVIGRLDGTLLRTDFSDEEQAYTRAIIECIEQEATVPPASEP